MTDTPFYNEPSGEEHLFLKSKEMTNYSGNEVAAVILASKIKNYWKRRGYHPNVWIEETEGLFSIRSNIKSDWN